MRVALRYISRYGTIGLRSYFYFVKKQGENKEKRHHRDSVEEQNGSTEAPDPE